MEGMATRFALKFRSGSFFIDVDHPTGGERQDALTFINEAHARWWFGKFAPWVWQNGGMLVPMEAAS